MKAMKLSSLKQQIEELDACENEGSYNPPEWAGEFYDMSERALRVVRGDVPEANFGNISTIRGEEE